MVSGRRVSLGHLTMIDATPGELVAAAAEGGFDHVGIRVISPRPEQPLPADLVGDSTALRDVLTRLEVTGIGVWDVEALWLAADTDVGRLPPALDVAAALGARYLVVIGDDPEPTRLRDNLARTVELAATRGLRVALEPVTYAVVSDIPSALRLLRDVAPVGVDRSQAGRDAGARHSHDSAGGGPPMLPGRDAGASRDTGPARGTERDGPPRGPVGPATTSADVPVGVLVDSLHFFRSTTPVEPSALPAGEVAYIQVADAPASAPRGTAALRREAREQRCLPGQGDLDLAGLLAALPGHLTVEAEVPGPHVSRQPRALAAREVRDHVERLLQSRPAELALAPEAR